MIYKNNYQDEIKYNKFEYDIPKDFDYCETDDTFDFSGIEDVYM